MARTVCNMIVYTRIAAHKTGGREIGDSHHLRTDWTFAVHCLLALPGGVLLYLQVSPEKAAGLSHLYLQHLFPHTPPVLPADDPSSKAAWPL